MYCLKYGISSLYVTKNVKKKQQNKIFFVKLYISDKQEEPPENK